MVKEDLILAPATSLSHESTKWYDWLK